MDAANKSHKLTHYPALDGLRGIAIVLVILVHSFNAPRISLFWSGVQFIAGAGWLGVTLFFTLSGFLICGILIDSVGKEGWYRNFFFRRTLRIVPLYVSFLTFIFVILPRWRYASEHIGIPQGYDAALFWVYLANMREWFIGHASPAQALGPVWSLAVEEQVYLLLPIVIWLVPFEQLGKVFVAFFAFSVCWKLGTAATRQSVELRYNWMPACLDAFAAGALVAWALRHPKWRVRLPSIASSTLAVASALAAAMALHCKTLFFWDNPKIVLTFAASIFSPLFGAIIAKIVLGNERQLGNRLLASGWLRWCGQYSYAAYLFHETAIELLRPAFDQMKQAAPFKTPATAALFTVLILAISFVSARLSWELLERHFLSLKKYFVTSPSAAVPRLRPGLLARRVLSAFQFDRSVVQSLISRGFIQADH